MGIADTDIPAGSQSLGTTAPGGRRTLTPEVIAHLGPLRAALTTFEMTRQPAALDQAFGVARSLVAALPGTAERARPDLEELRWLGIAAPDFGRLLSVAAGEAERVVSAGVTQLWNSLEIPSPPPTWTPAEREAARMLFACACAPGAAESDRVPAGLRGLSAGRMASLVCDELARDEQLWRRALGDRYDSVHHRYAPRTAWRKRGLTDLIRADPTTLRAVKLRLERWMIDGGRLPAFAGELEAALVHVRTPAKFA